jgi:hypothetical protein
MLSLRTGRSLVSARTFVSGRRNLGSHPGFMLLLHTVELDAGRWECRRGMEQLDDHVDLAESITHLQTVGRELGGAGLVIHQLDGSVSRQS